MITQQDITAIGKFNKPHGIHGEISASISAPIELLRQCSCVICDIDGILVPFFLNDIRNKSLQSVLLKVDGINNQQESTILVNKDIYALKKEYVQIIDENEQLPVDFFINYSVEINEKLQGIISDIDDSTANVLFAIRIDNGKTVLIPAVDEFISSIDTENRSISFSIPEELLNL